MVVMACELVDRVKTIPDYRRQCRNLKHRLEDILVLGFCGTLAGCVAVHGNSGQLRTGI